MDYKKAIELLQIFLMENMADLGPDLVLALSKGIAAMMAIDHGAKRLGVDGVYRLLIGGGEAATIAIRGGDPIGATLTEMRKIIDGLLARDRASEVEA